MDEKMWTNGINEASKMALLAWEKETGIELVQINGQRRYGGPPPGWVGGPPPAGTEVYIARLPQDIYENTLIPLFESVGKLYEFRLMMTFSGLNRGFAYARYTSLQDASNAIATFHRFQMRKGCAIVVCRSTQKCELIVNGLDISVSQQELQAMLQMVTEGILSVTLHASPCQRPAKLAVLKYRSHEAAALAKKALTEGNLRLRGAGMRVDWLDPQMKQKLQLWEEEPSSNGVHGDKSLAVPRLAALPPLLECPNILSWRHRLRTPLFTTKCVQVNADGWQRFWYQVVIPGYHMPISGFTWVLQDKQGQSEHEKVKMAAALHILQVLGESLVSPCMASVPTSCLSQSLEVSPGSVELWHFWGGVQGGSQAGRQG
uniref:DND microRNA-mediated repression inhibitor 1 n=1 Tax=Corvus moneduloides TaxID=1196302 RepID=A0A8U7NZ09_CORMO